MQGNISIGSPPATGLQNVKGKPGEQGNRFSTRTLEWNRHREKQKLGGIGSNSHRSQFNIGKFTFSYSIGRFGGLLVSLTAGERVRQSQNCSQVNHAHR